MDFLYAWIVMLFLGAAHSTDGRVPAFGYWTTLCLVIAAGIVVSGAKHCKK